MRSWRLKGLLGSSSAVALASVLTAGAWAEEVAPAPVDPGEFYLVGTAGAARLAGGDFKAHQLFVDDSSITADGSVTITNPQGYLVHYNIREDEFIPEITLGYAFKEMIADNVVRLDLTVYGHKFEAKGASSFLAPTPGGHFIDDGSGPVETGLMAYYPPIDGEDNEDDTQGGFPYGGMMYDSEWDYEQKSGGFDAMVFFDNRVGKWAFSRGFGPIYNYTSNEITHTFGLDDLSGIAEGGDADYLYDYDLTTHYFGGRFQFSAGYEFWRGTSFFATGHLRMMGAATILDGHQSGLCLSTCDLDSTPQFLGRGTRDIDEKEVDWAYDAALGLGFTARLSILRLTVQGGGTRIGGWASPRDIMGEVEIARTSGWGYYAKASAGVAF